MRRFEIDTAINPLLAWLCGFFASTDAALKREEMEPSMHALDRLTDRGRSRNRVGARNPRASDPLGARNTSASDSVDAHKPGTTAHKPGTTMGGRD